MASVNMKRAVITILNGSKATTGYYGLSDVYADTDDIAQDIFWQYSSAERSAILAKWAASPIRVSGEYALSDFASPKIMVLRSSDRERNDHIGDYTGVDSTLSDADDFFEHHEYGTEFDESVSLIVQVAGHGPGQRDDVYMVMREIILRARPYFHGLGLVTMVWADGRDGEGFRTDMSPQIIHEARASLRYINSIRWIEKSDRILKIRSNLTGYDGGLVTVDPFSDET